MHTPMHSHTLHKCTHAMHMHTLHTCTHAMHMHTLHTRHTPCTHTMHRHTLHTRTRPTLHKPCTHALHKGKKLREKEGNPCKLSFLEVGVAISAKHISPAPKGESSSTVELQIGGAAAPELVWWSRSPPKHALRSILEIDRLGCSCSRGG
jgi:hypothetical protein